MRERDSEIDGEPL